MSDKITELIAVLHRAADSPYTQPEFVDGIMAAAAALEAEHLANVTNAREADEALKQAKKWQKLWETAANGVLSLQAERDALRSQIEEACVVLVAGSIPLGMTQAEFYERLVCDAFEILSRAIDTREEQS